MKKYQSGFTLVEIAIVLVIIGLLLGGVLKGQEMIENAKTKSLINDMKGITAAYYSYQDRYQAIPGDDLNAALKFAGTFAGDGNGAIAGTYNGTTTPAAGAATESIKVWQHLRLAGFLTGDSATATIRPGSSTFGGFMGVEGVNTAFLMSGPKVCAGSVPSKHAQAVDTTIDDGIATTGSFRSGAAGAENLATPTAATGTAYVAGAQTIHTVCLKF